jgi:fumarate reductase flavoprotein subunit
MSAPDFDVVVVGAGGAGLSAANAAADLGARVLLVDAAARAGGSTALSGGVFYAAGTSIQRECGIDDNPADQFRYYMNLNQHKLEAALVHRLCYDSADALDWLIRLGAEFKAADLYVAGVDGLRRGHRCAGAGAMITGALEGALTGKSVELALGTRVRQLLHDPATGQIAGIEVDGQRVTARSVVLASGGFGANPTLLGELYPDATVAGDMAWYIGSSHSQGDGLQMGRAAGAELAGFNRGLLLLTPGFARDVEPYLPPWLVYVNREGRRFVNETTEYSVLAEVLKEQTNAECFGIFDERSRSMASARPAPNWSADRLAHFAAIGRLQSAADLPGLAALIGARPQTLRTTLETYYRDCGSGSDRLFFKRADALQPISTPPFYAARIRPAVICWTGTGLRINRDACVLNEADRPIAGLYAAGETTGGMFGECYAAGGASIANAVVFGRVAGASAAAHARG